MSLFADIPQIQPDLAFALVEAFAADPSDKKVDLCPGFYRDESARPWVLPSVVEAEKQLYDTPARNHEHLPLTGHEGFIAGARKLAFGSEVDLARVATIQTVSGTGANHLGARFLSDRLNPSAVWISDPSWINHGEIWETVNPGIERRLYPYFNREALSLDFTSMLTALRRDTKRGDVVILHACAHNPTGIDLSQDQWKSIADLFEEKGLLALFDMAYQGFASGSIDQDAWAVRHFFSRKSLEFAVAQSFSKNFGLYGERVGALHVVTHGQDTSTTVLGALIKLSRAEITSCPAYGAALVSGILHSPVLFQQWQRDLERMSSRMKHMRKLLHAGLVKSGTRGSWDHLLTDIGMFSMTGISKEQVAELMEKHHVYLLPSGRISVTGLTEHNVDKVVVAFREVLGSI